MRCSTAAFAAATAPLAEADKLGAVTFRFPPSPRNREEHRGYLRRLPDLLPGHPIAVEYRRRDRIDAEHAEATLAPPAEAGPGSAIADESQVGTGSGPPVYRVTNPRRTAGRFRGRNAGA